MKKCPFVIIYSKTKNQYDPKVKTFNTVQKGPLTLVLNCHNSKIKPKKFEEITEMISPWKLPQPNPLVQTKNYLLDKYETFVAILLQMFRFFILFRIFFDYFLSCMKKETFQFVFSSNFLNKISKRNFKFFERNLKFS